MKKELLKHVNKIIIFLVVLIVGFGGYYGYNKWIANKVSNNNQNQATVAVARGDLSVKISGTGTVRPIQRYEIVSLVTGTILSAPFEEGMQVKAGDLLYQFDNSDAYISIEKLKNSIAKFKLTDKQNEEEIKNLEVTAPFDGRIINFSVKEGDNIGGKIADIVDDTKLVARVPFNASQVQKIQVGQDAQVIVAEYMQYIDGKVISKSSSGNPSSDGSILYNVEIEIKNGGALVPGTQVRAIAKTSQGDMISPTEGPLEYAKEQAIYAETSGIVKKVYVQNNERITAGQKILELENDDVLVNRDKNYLELQDLQLNLEQQQKELEDYRIVSPIDGIVVEKNAKAGDTINNKDNNVLMVVADMSKMVFSMDIDELDISKVKIGQNVEVTADALPGKKFEGKVSNIAAEGQSSNGVTTYEVEVTIENYGELRSGMNVNAEILVQNKENVLYLPMAAVQKSKGKTFVFVKNSNDLKNTSVKNNTQTLKSSSKQSEAATNVNDRIMKQVEVGINNDQYIEIVSGLTEGEEVLLPYTPSQLSSSNRNGMMGGIPGMGGMPREPGGTVRLRR